MSAIEIKPTHNAFDDYYTRLNALKQGLQMSSEGSTRRAFSALLDATASARKWTLAEEVSDKRKGKRIRLDGILYDAYRLPRGYWEAKDKHDDLEAEILSKQAKDYPISNIIFEDTQRAVLIQDGVRVFDVDMFNRDELARLLTRFYNYDLEPFEKFAEAVSYFTNVIPDIGKGLKQKIEIAHKENKAFQNEFADFMELCRTSLNPNIAKEAVDEMLIQHLLTERLIRKIFQGDFVQKNIIARKVEDVIGALTKPLFDRSEFQAQLDPFYNAIENAAATLADSYQDKQRFINTVYEQFFQGYSVKVADTHGIVYTPQEIVDFMCAAVEEVLHDEFGKKLGEDGVTVLDPATGTGNFIINLLNRVDERYRRDFYKNHLFANEVMLMPYYIASLNIEHAYYELEGQYESFEGLCFVDTLDLAKKKQLQFSFMNEANTERVQRQQEADITVIIGNPPYNMGQVNDNDNNRNRAYEVIDGRVRDTYVKASTATLKMHLYDAYVKFFRWATDRLGDKDGVVCFVSNNNFVEDDAFNGMRKHLLNDFSRIYHLDLHGNVRQNTKISGTTHNVFGIQTGVGITVAIRSSNHTEKKLFYHRVPDMWRKEEKLAYLTRNVIEAGVSNSLNTIDWERIHPNSRHTWIQLEFSDEFLNYVPLGTREAKAESGNVEGVLFSTYSPGVMTGRDAFVRDFSIQSLEERIAKFAGEYNAEVDRYKRNRTKDVDEFVAYDSLKWSDTLKRHLRAGHYAEFQRENIRISSYRPYSKSCLYYDDMLIDRGGLFKTIFPSSIQQQENSIICCTSHSQVPFVVQILNNIPDVAVGGRTTRCFPFYVYDADGTNRRENITDWALNQFRTFYEDDSITKWDIFYYVYALLHHPAYRERYADNLKRELPRIPFVPLKPLPDASGRGWGGVDNTQKSPPNALGGDLEGGSERGAGHGWSPTHTELEQYLKSKEHAREMRKDLTPAENQLWQRLRKNQVHGYKFRRQHTIGVFIADFFCAQASLVVEVDGVIHEQQEEYDAMRQAYLESLGMRVLRFTNGEVMQQIDAVVERIGEVLLELQSNPTPASLRLASPPQSIKEGEQALKSLPDASGRDLGKGSPDASESALKSPPDASGGDLEGGFWVFARAGKKLADIHLNYETYKQYPVQRVRKQGVKINNRVEKMRPKNKRKIALAILKPLPDASGRGWGGVDDASNLEGVLVQKSPSSIRCNTTNRSRSQASRTRRLHIGSAIAVRSNGSSTSIRSRPTRVVASPPTRMVTVTTTSTSSIWWSGCYRSASIRWMW